MIVNCSPITDDQGRVRGCLVTFDNVAVIHRKNEEMGQMLDQLDRTRAADRRGRTRSCGSSLGAIR